MGSSFKDKLTGAESFFGDGSLVRTVDSFLSPSMAYAEAEAERARKSAKKRAKEEANNAMESMLDGFAESGLREREEIRTFRRWVEEDRREGSHETIEDAWSEIFKESCDCNLYFDDSDWGRAAIYDSEKLVKKLDIEGLKYSLQFLKHFPYTGCTDNLRKFESIVEARLVEAEKEEAQERRSELEASLPELIKAKYSNASDKVAQEQTISEIIKTRQELDDLCLKYTGKNQRDDTLSGVMRRGYFCDFETVVGGDGLNVPTSHFGRVNFVDVNLSGVSFRNPDDYYYYQGFFYRTGFYDCNLSMADFSRADLDRTTFVGCNLSNTVFNGADLKYVTFNDCILTKTDFSKAKTEIGQTSFVNCKFCGVNTKIFNRANVWALGCDFTENKIPGMQFWKFKKLPASHFVGSYSRLDEQNGKVNLGKRISMIIKEKMLGKERQ